MNLENTIRKVSLSLAGLSLAASMSCTSDRPDKLVGREYTEPVAPAAEQVSPGNAVHPEQRVDLSKVRVLSLHYHKQFSEQDLIHYFRAEYPATKHMSFNQYKTRVEKLNHAYDGNMVDWLKLPDANENKRVGSRDYFP
jgi:hypothetical protein